MTDIEIMEQYLLMKLRLGDHHAVCDASMDLREMTARLDEQREKTKSEGTSRCPSKDETLAGLPKEHSGLTSLRSELASRAAKESLRRELGIETVETHWGTAVKGFASASLTASSTTQDLLYTLREDLHSIQEQLNILKGVSLDTQVQLAELRGCKSDL